MSGRTGVVVLAVVLVAAQAAPAEANGVNTHVWIARHARDHLPEGRLKTLLQDPAYENALINGAFFPDGGYAVNDPYGEVAHWEPFINAYLEWIRAHYAYPFDDPEAATHVAFLFGLAAHSIGDQTFDPMYMKAARGYDAAGWSDDLLDSFDTATDVFLVDQTGERVMPEVFVPIELASVFASIGTNVDPAVLDNAQDLMIRAVLAYGQSFASDPAKVAEYEARYPWGAMYLMDPDEPGSPPTEARACAGLYQAIWWRLAGEFRAENLIVATQPSEGRKGHPTDHTLVESQVVVVFGHGIDAATVTGDRFSVRDSAGKTYAIEVDAWSSDYTNTVRLVPMEDWAADETFTVTIGAGLHTIDGHVTDFVSELHFSTSAPGASEPTPLQDPTPITDEPAVPPPDETGGDGGGCAVGGRGAGGASAWLVLLALVIGCRRRRG